MLPGALSVFPPPERPAQNRTIPICRPLRFRVPGTPEKSQTQGFGSSLARLLVPVPLSTILHGSSQESRHCGSGILVGRLLSVVHFLSRRPSPSPPTLCDGPPYGRTFDVLRSGVQRVTHGGSPTRWSSRSPRYREVRQLRDRGRLRPMRPVPQPSLFGSSEGDLRVLPRHRQTYGRQGQIGRVFLPLVLLQRGRDVFRRVSYVIHPHLGHRRSS